MRIGIDISQIVYGTGVASYTKNLVENLLKLNSQNDYILFGGTLRQAKKLRDFTNSLGGNFKTKILPISPAIADLIWNKLHIAPIEKLLGPIDVFHASDWTQPPARAFKVTTIHDLSPLLFPQSAKRDLIRNIVSAHKKRLSWIAKETDRIIAVSNATKDDIIHYLGVSEAKIRVIYEAASSEFVPKTDEEVKKVLAKYKIYGEYLLAVGTSPRKNLDMVVKAYEVVKTGYKGLKLVVVGEGKRDELRGVVRVRGADNNELAALYSGAKVFLYPSLYEGFGLPILEAFSCGCPVVTSNLSSMPEIAGDAAILVDPGDVEAIAAGIREAVREKRKLIRRGFRRASAFSWEKTARQTLAVYNESK